jgi:hypothetical protein
MDTSNAVQTNPPVTAALHRNSALCFIAVGLVVVGRIIVSHGDALNPSRAIELGIITLTMITPTAHAFRYIRRESPSPDVARVIWYLVLVASLGSVFSANVIMRLYK